MGHQKMIITMWLNVIDGSGPQWNVSGGKLMYKKTETGCVPVPRQDRVALWAYDHDDPADGPMWPVASREMDTQGNWIVHLAHMLIDPSPEQESLTGMWNRTTFPFQPWRSAEGNAHRELMAAGWRNYHDT
jgi:hypothetical protein